MFHRQQGQISQKGNKALEKHEQRSYTTAPQVNGMHPARLIQRVKDDPSSLSSDEVLTLQETMGNRAVSRLLAGRNGQQVQPKLTIGEPGDKYEQEADRVANEVVQQINAPAASGRGQAVQREEPEEKDQLQIKPMVQGQSDLEMAAAAPDMEASINQGRGSAQPLADNIRQPMLQAATLLLDLDGSIQREVKASGDGISAFGVHQENKTGLVVVQREQKELLQKKSDIQYGTRKNDCGTLVDAYIDANDVPKGKSPPSSRPNWWNNFKGLSNGIKDFSENYLVQGHLLNHHVGGPDNMDNLTPITGSANTTMLNFFEKSVKDSVTKGEDVLYRIEAEYHNNKPPTAQEIAGSNLLPSDKSILDNSGYLNFFCDWIYAEYTVYPHVGDKVKLVSTTPIKESPGLWVKNESSEQKGTF